MWKRLQKLVTPIIGYLIIFALILIIVGILALFGGVFMHIFGFQYETVGSLILFFLIVTFISIPIESFSGAIVKFLAKKAKGDALYGITYLCVDTLTTFLAMTLVDSLMDSIAATPLSIILFALTMALITIYLGRKGY